MAKRIGAIFALACFLAISAAYAYAGKEGGTAINQDVTQPLAQQQIMGPGGVIEVIQQFSVSSLFYGIPLDMKVSDDGSYVIYIGQRLEGGKPYECSVFINGYFIDLEHQLCPRDKDPEDCKADRIGNLTVNSNWTHFACNYLPNKKGLLFRVRPMIVYLYRFRSGIGKDTFIDCAAGREIAEYGFFPSYIVKKQGEFASFWTEGPQGGWVLGIQKLDVWGNKRFSYDDRPEFPLKPNLGPGGPVLCNTSGADIYAYCVVDMNLKKLMLVRGGRKVLEGYDTIEPVFRPGSEAISYIAKKGNKYVLAVDEKVQTTQFIPVRGLTFSHKGDVYAYAATARGREFAVRKGGRVKKDGDFIRVSSLALDPAGAKVAYVAKDTILGGEVQVEWVVVEDRKVTPAYSCVTFNREVFEKSGEVVFAGYDAITRKILVGRVKAPAQ